MSYKVLIKYVDNSDELVCSEIEHDLEGSIEEYVNGYKFWIVSPISGPNYDFRREITITRLSDNKVIFYGFMKVISDNGMIGVEFEISE